MSTPPAVLFVHPSDEAYGADRILLDLVLGLRDRGHQVSVLLADDLPPGWLSARLREAGIQVERGPLAPARRRYLHLAGLPGYARSLVRARRYVRRRARKAGAAVIHLNTSALLVGAMLGRPGGARLVWHIHEIVERPRVLAWFFRLVPVLTADRLIAVSDAVRRHLTPAGRFQRRTVTIHNGLAPREPAPMPGLRRDGRPLVAFVGRLNRWKGYDLFVEAVSAIASGHPATDFVIAGDAPPGEEWRLSALQRTLAEAGLTERVRTLGFVADGAAVIEAADIVVAPSRWPDPFPTVVLEGMRGGRAVIASAHGGAPEMIVNGVSGVLVPPGDPAALAEAIGRLLDSPAERERIGSAARERILTTFTLERMIDEVEQVYRSLPR